MFESGHIMLMALPGMEDLVLMFLFCSFLRLSVLEFDGFHQN